MPAAAIPPADLARENRELRAVIEDVIVGLDHPGTCCFEMCPGPDQPFVNMATCRVCAAVIGLRGALAGSIVFDSARERLDHQEGGSSTGEPAHRDNIGNRAPPVGPGTATPRPVFAIRRVLDVSTGHLRFETCDQLGDYDGMLADPTKYGWLMYVPQEQPEKVAAEHDWPDELLPLVRIAIDHNCTFIMFDAEGDRCGELPTWDW